MGLRLVAGEWGPYLRETALEYRATKGSGNIHARAAHAFESRLREFDRFLFTEAIRGEEDRDLALAPQSLGWHSQMRSVYLWAQSSENPVRWHIREDYATRKYDLDALAGELTEETKNDARTP